MENKSISIKIVGTGSYLPLEISNDELLKKVTGDVKKNKEYIENHAGVLKRHFVQNNETAAYMGAKAIEEALVDSNLQITDIDCIISASGGIEQPIPCNASLIKEAMRLQGNPIPAFDINCTCLSFVVALEQAAYLINGGRYKKIIIVSSEIASVGLNWEQKESCFLFGDGAVAVIVSCDSTKKSNIIKSHMENYCEGAHSTEIRGGGSSMPSYLYKKENIKDYLFDMNGREAFSITLKRIDNFMEKLFEDTDLNIDDIQKIIPHQASGLALKALKKKLKVKDDRFVNIISNYGNMIAASIPLALHLQIKEKQIKRGDKILLIGTSAGLSIGSVIITY